MWDLTRVPYKHAILVIGWSNLDSKQFVHLMLSINALKKAYEPLIYLITGQEYWPKIVKSFSLEPSIKKKPSKRPKKQRHKGKDEP